MAAVTQSKPVQPQQPAQPAQQVQMAQPAPKPSDPPAGHPMSGKTSAEITAHFGSTSQAIRGLAAEGWSRSQISKALGKRYQHVRNVLITPVKNPGQRGNVQTTAAQTTAEPAQPAAAQK